MRLAMSLSKSEKILVLINFFLQPEDHFRYQYEADTIAQSVRKNSSLATLEKLVREKLEGLSDDTVHRLAACIKESV